MHSVGRVCDSKILLGAIKLPKGVSHVNKVWHVQVVGIHRITYKSAENSHSEIQCAPFSTVLVVSYGNTLAVRSQARKGDCGVSRHFWSTQ
jgi:hypothetical protein